MPYGVTGSQSVGHWWDTAEEWHIKRPQLMIIVIPHTSEVYIRRWCPIRISKDCWLFIIISTPVQGIAHDGIDSKAANQHYMEKAIRKLWGLPNMARRALLPPRVCSKPSVEQIYQHIAKIYNEIYNGFSDKMLFLFNKANLRDLIAATGLVILLKFDPNHRFFVPCDLEIWWMALENNRAPLLYYIKLCASFQIHRWIQIGITVRKR